MIETRYADPVTCLDLSLKYVCHGSAMGRIAFYDIDQCKDTVYSNSQQELIRAITHSTNGDCIYVSIGCVSCQRIEIDSLDLKDVFEITEKIDHDEIFHKVNRNIS